MAIITEKELEDYIFESMNDNSKTLLGLEPHKNIKNVFRQVSIEGYGVIDLLIINAISDEMQLQLEVTIVELKKDEVNFSALGQICRYKQAIERFFSDFEPPFFDDFEVYGYNIIGMLVGSDYAQGDICYAVDSMDWLSCHLYSLSLESGVEFEESGRWYATKEDFSKISEIIKENIKHQILDNSAEGDSCPIE